MGLGGSAGAGGHAAQPRQPLANAAEQLNLLQAGVGTEWPLTSQGSSLSPSLWGTQRWHLPAQPLELGFPWGCSLAVENPLEHPLGSAP